MELIRISFDRDHYHLLNEMTDWCQKKFGYGHWNTNIGKHKWSVESMFGYTHFYFREERDAVLFTLTWR